MTLVQYSGVARRLIAPVRQGRTRLGNISWERWLGIETRGVVESDCADAVHYATMSYATIGSILGHLDLRPSDVFVDIGSGKGRVLCCAARYAAERVIGVEMSEPLCAAARENARRLRGRRAPISIYQSLANDFDYSSATVLFLFNPFGAATLESVLRRVARDVRNPLRIAYANPEHDKTFQRQGWLERSDYWDAATSGLEHSVAFYSSR